jgi:hypothetical protein
MPLFVYGGVCFDVVLCCVVLIVGMRPLAVRVLGRWWFRGEEGWAREWRVSG